MEIPYLIRSEKIVIDFFLYACLLKQSKNKDIDAFYSLYVTCCVIPITYVSLYIYCLARCIILITYGNV